MEKTKLNTFLRAIRFGE